MDEVIIENSNNQEELLEEKPTTIELSMSELIIETHDFEKSIKQIKVFSEKIPKNLEFKMVKTDGWFFHLGEHKVTGTELNTLTEKIQDYLIDFNLLHIKFIKEFGQVYNALKALDKDYIQAILIAFKSAEKANDEVKVAQGDITKTIDLQKKTINVLKQFKEKIESYEHLEDVDKIWDNSQKIREEILSINSDIRKINSYTKNLLQAVETLSQFKSTLENYEHLKDIDILWSKSESFIKEISGISKKLDDISISIVSQEQTINYLLQFKERLDNYEHLKEIDETWGRIKVFESEMTESKDNLKCHKEQIHILNNCLQEFQKKNDESSKTFSKKLKIVYAIAGSSIGIAIIEFVLLLLRII
jgi:DNA repair ATPase RecN